MEKKLNCLQELMNEYGIDPSVLAKKSQVTERTLYDIRMNKKNGKSSTMIKVVNAINDLIKEDITKEQIFFQN